MKKRNLFKNSFFILSILFVFIFLNETLANQNIESKGIGVVYWHGDINKNKIALTFDDGPNWLYTPQVLDILKRYKVKATFFLIGKNVEAAPGVAKRIAEDGHCIGNHTYDHPDLLLDTMGEVKNQIKKAEDIIKKTTGVTTYLLRTPYGAEDHRVLVEAEKLGYVIVQWSVTCGNGGKEISSDIIIKNVVSEVKNGAIILLHDGNRLSKNPNRDELIKGLPAIIESLQKEGYIFVTIPELLNLEHK
jgi:peptidoglycan/xylan/chitin deacetylase (PgdA/CDA1 family)